MSFRKTIDLIESVTDANLAHHVAEMIASGEHEGFNPYWKLIADERILSDLDAMGHISTMVMDGYSSGLHPHWELKTVGGEPEQEIEEEVLLPSEDEVVDSMVADGLMDDEIIDEERAVGRRPAPSPVHGNSIKTHSGNSEWVSDEDLEATSDWYDANVSQKTPSPASFNVVCVAETHGSGKGWYEVPHDEATMFVVEDEEGNVVEHYTSYEEAEAAAAAKNNGDHDDVELTEVDVDPTDNADIDTPTRFHDSENFVVIINAIHERGPRQQEALLELRKRGLWLSDEQKAQAGLLPPEM